MDLFLRCLVTVWAVTLISAAEAQPQSDKPAQKPTTLTGGVAIFRSGAQALDSRAQLLRQSPTLDSSPQQPFPLRATQLNGAAVENRQISALSRYDLEIIIDRSMSMKRRDCPGGLSRWDWCALQATAVARALSPYAAHGLTITRFATDFDVHEHASAQDVANILELRDFQFGTRLSEPLAARLNQFFTRYKPGDKPLIIAVITDGVPYPRPEPRLVRQVLVKASRRITDPRQVNVVFLQVGGNDPRGRFFLWDLSTNLRSYGARYQYVRTVPFEVLTQIGLAQA
ncbi:MAG TPA: hypothetical protein V6D08_21690, partial [Candidatus Obscuribacterales bacterium]